MKLYIKKLVIQKIKEYEKKHKRIVTEEMKYLYTIYINISYMMKFTYSDVWLESFFKNEFYYIEVEAKKVKI
jgi:hypothetical protein